MAGFDKVIGFFQKALTLIPVLIYDMIISRFLTIYSHNFLCKQMKDITQAKSVLDIGVGTGKPLYKIVENFDANTKILGIDIDKNYIAAAQKLFAHHPNVEIRCQNFYDMNEKEAKNKFDVVLFSFSFMLMPDKKKAIEKAKQLLNHNGQIIFLLTLQKKKNVIAEKIKPLIKYLTTIDFGQVTYEKEFFELIQESNLKIQQNLRVHHITNPLLYLFKVYTVSCTKQ